MVFDRDIATLRRFTIHGEDADPAAKILFEAVDTLAVRVLGRPLPAVFTVHIEDEVDRFFVLDHAAETDSGQKRFAGARLAEDTV